MDTVNRVVWTVVGAVLLVCGATLAAAGFGAVPQVDRGTALLAPALVTRWRGWQPWSWWAVVAAGLLLAVLGLVWARAQLRRRGGPALDDLTDADLPAPPPTDRADRVPDGAVGGPAAGDVANEIVIAVADAGRLPGRTRVRSGALVHGLTGDLARHPRVRRAAVALTGDAAAPRMWARLDVTSGADLPALHRHVADSLSRFTTTTGLCPRDVQVVVQIRDTTERVR